MTQNNDRVNHLIDRLESLIKKQEDLSHQIRELSTEVFLLKGEEESIYSTDNLKLQDTQAESQPVKDGAQQQMHSHRLEQTPKTEIAKDDTSDYAKGKSRLNLERYIGESIISKIGILITIVGVGIGARYAIEHQYLSPTIRIILGYLFGIALLGIALNLKRKYESYSAVLLSGSMAIMYFITFVAYNFYDLYSQSLSFVLMLIFTAFTVAAALRYNQQVIAHIGLVGAYAIPLLLSDGSGRVEVLFAYMAIINIGILLISVKKYWKSVYFTSFGITWVAFTGWMLFKYRVAEHFSMAAIFLCIFFVVFYLTFLVFKLIRKDKFNVSDIVLLLLNSFILYFIGYAMLSERFETGNQLGPFTLANAFVHSMVGLLLYWQKLTDRNLFYFVLGLVLVFLTIAVPVQLNGNWVTLLWAGEAAILFWIGRTRGVGFYEKLAFPLIILAFGSLVHDWSEVYYGLNPDILSTRIKPIFNWAFVTSIITIGLFAFINALRINPKYQAPKYRSISVEQFAGFAIPTIFLATVYFPFALEISTYFSQLYADSTIILPPNEEGFEEVVTNTNIYRYKIVWLINYSLLFFAALTFFAASRVRKLSINRLILAFNTVALTVFLVIGLYQLSALRDSYLEQNLAQYYSIGKWNIGIRYISFVFLGAMLAASYRMVRGNGLHKRFFIALEMALHVSMVWIASSELISWMDLVNSTQSYKLGLSILWGVYALVMVALGLWKKRQHLRIGSMVLFAVTLVKLFLYDIAHLETISKTIVLLSLGVLLLVISFLYNKYKHLIVD